MILIKTGKLGSESGVYKCPACERQISVAKGEVMPSCDQCGPVVWEQILKL